MCSNYQMASSPKKRSPSDSIAKMIGADKQPTETPTVDNSGGYECDESDYESGEDDDVFELPDDDTNFERAYSLKKHHLVDQSDQYSKKTYQAFPSNKIFKVK